MEQKWIMITRNYSRKEGPEMFSLTKTREIEKESTYFRQRAESYIALYDVQIQLLEEMILVDYATPEFLTSRKRGLAKQMKALVTKLEQEIESGNLTEAQVFMNDSTIDEVYERVGNMLGERKELTPKFKLNDIDIKSEVPVEDIQEVSVETYDEVKKDIDDKTTDEESKETTSGNVDDFLL